MTIREFFERYGGTLAVAGVLALLVVLLPSTTSQKGTLSTTNGQRSGAANGTASNAAGAAAASDAPGALAGIGGRTSGGTGGTGAGGAADGTGAATGGVQFGTGPDCRPDGRQKSIDTYAPPCANWVKGTDNGGATGKGVSGDKILLIRYQNYVDPATQAALQGAGATDDDATLQRQFDASVRYFNTHYQTYGREVVWENFVASGHDDNDEALRADAVAIANKNAFAVVTLNAAGPPVLVQELVARGVVCMCSVSLSTTFYTSLAPYIFSTLPIQEEFYANATEYICKRLVGNGRTAKWAGDEFNPTQGFTRKPRKIGLIWYEGGGATPEPGYVAAHDTFIQQMANTCGLSVVDFGYLFDLTKAGDQSTAMISKLNSEHVTTVLFAVDPLYPIFFTKEASRQAYFPEWFNMGTALTDQTFFGRTYDQQQWKHSFGLSPLGAQLNDVSKSAAYREYYQARPNDSQGSQGVAVAVTRAPIALLFTGIHMAGPSLNADTFAQGMFAYPHSGGNDAAHPLVYFTRESPTATKDWKEIWWNTTGTGNDETGKNGVGIMMSADGGARHGLGQWPSTDAKAFDPSGAVHSVDTAEPGADDAQPPPDSERCLSCA